MKLFLISPNQESRKTSTSNRCQPRLTKIIFFDIYYPVLKITGKPHPLRSKRKGIR